MDIGNKQEALSKFPLFSGLAPQHLETLANIAVPKRITKNRSSFGKGRKREGSISWSRER